VWYADHHWQELHDRCIAHVNIDSVGGRGAIINRHAWAMPETRGIADRAMRALAAGGFEGGRVGRAGDQSFLGIGVPSLLMSLSEQPGQSPDASRDFNIRTGGATGGLGWWWHTTDNLPDKIDPAVLERDCKIYVGIIHALATSPVAPLDYVATAKAWHARLAQARKAAGRWIDVKPAIAEAARLVEAAGALQRRARVIERSGDRRAIRRTNGALMAIGRALIPIDYTAAGRFDHDLALEQRDVPRLASVRALATASGDDARHLVVQAVRDLNAVRHALATAADVAEVAGKAEAAALTASAASGAPSRRSGARRRAR
jgi:hypothetical protein